MKTWLINLWERLRGSYWFIPGLMTAAAVALGIGMITLDEQCVALAGREIPHEFRFDAEGKLRVVAPSETFVELAHAAFRPLRDRGTKYPEVAECLLRNLAAIAEVTQRPEDAAVLELHAREVLEMARDTMKRPRDAALLEEEHVGVRHALQKQFKAAAPG